MEANVKVIDKMLEQYGVEASREAKEALINFSSLFAQKFVRKCVAGRSSSKRVNAEEVRHAYELSKGLRSTTYQMQLEERRQAGIAKINAAKLIKEDEDEERGENTARSVMTVNFYNADIYHMALGKEQQLTFETKTQYQ